jgi:predicted alpha/beta-fold hydrolase
MLLAYVVASAVASGACISTRVVNLANLEVPVPPRDPNAGWKSEIDALLNIYDRAPVIAAEDRHLEPVEGGLTTLSYFGANAKPRVVDQRVGARPPALGKDVVSSCVAPTPAEVEAAQSMFATTGLPQFAPVWIPLSLHGDSAPESARCNERGQLAGADTERFYCLFGRLAMQPSDQRPLVFVVHGIFDSGAQEYVQRLAAELYGLGNSVFVPDLRDHGDTLRAAPEVATTLGMLEGYDLLVLARTIRRACGARVGRVGIAGVSGGGLAAIRAFTLDRDGSLDAGVIALSPLLDVPATVRDLSRTGPCAATRATELSLVDDVAITVAAGAAFFGGAALVQTFDGQSLDANTAIVAGIGAGAGLLSAITMDAWFDGGTTPCLSQNAIAEIVQDALRVRWEALRNSSAQSLSAAGRRMDPTAVTLEDYVRERAQFRAERLGVSWRELDAPKLSRDLRAALASDARRQARLVVVGAEDDPMTRIAGLQEFERRTRGMPQVYVRAVTRGGHGAMSIVQPTVMTALFERFFVPADH